jgi:hypothetical protein
MKPLNRGTAWSVNDIKISSSYYYWMSGLMPNIFGTGSVPFLRHKGVMYIWYSVGSIR